MTEKWNDEATEASRAALDQLFKIQDELAVQIAQLMQRKRVGQFSSADEEKAGELRTWWKLLSREIGDASARLLMGDPLPPQTLQ